MFGSLFHLDFWFDWQAQALSPTFERAFFIIFAGMIIFGAAARIVARHKKSDALLAATYQKGARLFLIMGTLGMFWFFFTYEEAYLLGARFWFLLWVVGFIVWIAHIVRFQKVQIPAVQAEMKHKAEYNKYLPRRNR